MKKKIFIGLSIGLFFMVNDNIAMATLLDRGTDSLGIKLIYDTDLDVTWYDYSNGYGVTSIYEQINWASNLSVNFNNVTINDWRLPKTIDGVVAFGYDGSTTKGFNITTSELGHLYYEELNNVGAFDTSGNYRLDAFPWLSNTGPFENLTTGMYWSETNVSSAPGSFWNFYTYSGYQFTLEDIYGGYGIAVRDGDVVASPVPEPTAMMLFSTGIAGLVGIKLKKRRRQ